MAVEDDFAQTWKDAVRGDAAPISGGDVTVTGVQDSTPAAAAAPKADRIGVTPDMTPEQQYAAIWKNEQNGYYGDEMVNPAPLPVDPTAGAPAAPAADASQGADDYRLPVPMTEDQFMAARYNPLHNGDRDKKLEPYWTFEEYADAWYKSDDSKLVNRKPAAGKIPAAGVQAAPAPVAPTASAAPAPSTPAATAAPASQVMQPAAMPATEDRFA